MLDPEIPEDRREQIASEARARIESGGSLKHDTSWGMRKLAYEIRQRTEADYRFFRFETGGELLDELSHNLRIADGVLRFRIFKVDPRAPAIVPPAPVASSGTAGRGARRSPGSGQRDAPAPAAEEEGQEPAAPPAEEAAQEPAAPAGAGEATGPSQPEAAAEAERADGGAPEQAEDAAQEAPE